MKYKTVDVQNSLRLPEKVSFAGQKSPILKFQILVSWFLNVFYFISINISVKFQRPNHWYNFVFRQQKLLFRVNSPPNSSLVAWKWSGEIHSSTC